MEDVAQVLAYYDADAEREWSRLERHPIEWRITTHYLERLIPPGSRVLDVGGGPGRYSLWLAGRGCDVTLIDLSPANVGLARQKAADCGIPLQAMAGDARQADALVAGDFDAVLLMGPLYHLTQEADRKQAIEAALRLLHPGGLLFAAFLSVNAQVRYALHRAPEELLSMREAVRCFVEGEAFAGNVFTQAYTPPPHAIAPMMAAYGLRQLHILGVESVCAMAEPQLLAQPPDVFDRWMEVAMAVCERTDLLPMSSHLLYIGQK